MGRERGSPVMRVCGTGERVSCNEGVWDGREGLLRVCGLTGERVFCNEGVWADGREGLL